MTIVPKFDLRRAERAYGDALAYMSKLTGLDRKRIVKAEAGVILKTAAARTKVAPVSAVTQAGRLRTLRGMGLTSGKVDRDGYRVTINAGKKGPYGRVWARKNGSDKWQLVMGNKFSRVNRHFDSPLWNVAMNAVRAAKSAIKIGVKKAKASRGLARQSWILIADRLGIDLASVQGGGSLSASAIATARKATVKGGKNQNNGRAREEDKAHQYFVTLINGLPYGRRIGLDRTLTVIMAGRVKYFATAVRKGFRGAMQDTTRLFPSWTLK